MATFSITIGNSLRVFGIAPSTKWGQSSTTMIWGSSKWGEGSIKVQTDFTKVITESFSIDSQIYQKQVQKSLSYGSLVVSHDMVSETLFDRSGQWLNVFTSDVTNAEQRAQNTWSSVQASDATFVTSSITQTSWSSG